MTTLAAGATVLFIGDSITHAHRRPEEVHDCYQLGCGYVNSAAAELTAARPAAGWRFLNRGVPGDGIGQMTARWSADVVAEAPAAVSVLIGVNDAAGPHCPPGTFREASDRLLDSTRQQLPNVRLLLMEPFGVAVPPHPTVDVISRDQLDRVTALQPIVRRVAAEHGAVFVPLQHLFTDASAAVDGIHPSAAGHWRIGRAWVAAARGAGWFPPEGA